MKEEGINEEKRSVRRRARGYEEIQRGEEVWIRRRWMGQK
jgi:hypothetical protein